ncbi:carbonic anhydrase [Streptomonospora sp. S1-112]|uniref:carbonic anhydrase n=1 Tax=Streptomonospora mangrovi TaxID=2883123 RepID=A0A9X3NNB7_9ACTN|nr:carbonic anhydrase [Streptomonospora mangrovi]MDA0566110.1 carbonic anhydrase [Streptomonospora mangrovi]
MTSAFDDVFAANADYAARFRHADLAPRAERGLAVVTCMDSRIDPLAALGLSLGDAKILRNAGGRVTDNVLANLVVGAYLLNVTRILVMPHTRCKMASVSGDAEVHDLIEREHGVDTRSLDFGTDSDQLAALRRDLERIRHHPLLPQGLEVAGAVYDVETGRVSPADL